MIRLIPAIAAAACLSACAPVDEPATDAPDAALANLDTSRACFFAREVNGFTNAPDGPGSSERLYVSTGVREDWLLETFGSCPELDFSEQIALDVQGSISVCTGQLETLLVPNALGDGYDRCPVRVLGRVIEADE